jgi:3D (Asp-Asp-Asp) domain-containing protein
MRLVGLVALSVLGVAGAAHAGSTRVAGCPAAVKPPVEHLIIRPRWVSEVLITEYYPAPEGWFTGRKVKVAGLPGKHRIDWLYSARGLAMQGEGIGADGRFYHFAGPYGLAWHNSRGRKTLPCRNVPGAWTAGSPAWLGASSQAHFARGPSLPLTYWRDVAVDPRLIQRGSSIFVRSYCDTPSHGWFVAADTGGAIIGHHLDVFRRPPSIPWSGDLRRDQRIYVVPPGFARPAKLHC